MTLRRSRIRVPERIPATPPPVSLRLAFALGAILAGCSAPLSIARSPFPAASDSATCANGGWSPPIEPRLPDGRRVAVHAPNLVRVKSGLAIVGAPTFVWHSATLPVDTSGATDVPQARSPFAGVLLRDDGSLALIPFPAGVRFMTKEFAVTDGSGGMHVVWGIPTSPPKPVFARTVAIQYAHFDGSTWSPPESVLVADELLLEHTLSRLLLVDGVLQLAVVARDPRASARQPFGIAYARRIGGRWETRRLPLTDMDARYMDMIALGSGRLLLTYVASIKGPDGLQPNALAYLSSSDGGAHWGTASVVRQLDPLDGYFLHAFRDRADGIHLLWTSFPAAETGVRIRHIVSSDLRSWSEPAETRMPTALFALDAALDQVDSMRVLIQQSGLPPDVAVVTEKGWLPSLKPPISPSYAPPSLSREDGTLYLTANPAEAFPVASSGAMAAAWLQISRLSPCSAPRATSTPARNR